MSETQTDNATLTVPRAEFEKWKAALVYAKRNFEESDMDRMIFRDALASMEVIEKAWRECCGKGEK